MIINRITIGDAHQTIEGEGVAFIMAQAQILAEIPAWGSKALSDAEKQRAALLYATAHRVAVESVTHAQHLDAEAEHRSALFAERVAHAHQIADRWLVMAPYFQRAIELVMENP